MRDDLPKRVFTSKKAVLFSLDISYSCFPKFPFPFKNKKAVLFIPDFSYSPMPP